MAAYPFEIHVTVKESSLERFTEVCNGAKVKPILLDLQNKDGTQVMQDLMTSSLHFGDGATVFAELARIRTALTTSGLEVIREKIETAPWYPSAPTRTSRTDMPNGCYFESHLAILADDKTVVRLRQLSHQLDCHVSRNIFKRINDGQFKIMLTYRKHDDVAESFKEEVDSIKTTLEKNGFVIDKTIVEFSIFDTKVSHDMEWIV